jgi:hypothetical protein
MWRSGENIIKRERLETFGALLIKEFKILANAVL